MYFTVYHTRQDRNNKRFGILDALSSLGGLILGESKSSEGSTEDPVSSSEGVTSSVTQEAITAVRNGGRSNMEKEFTRKDVGNGVLTQDQIDADAIARKLLGE